MKRKAATIEKASDHQVKLHLNAAEIDVPEHLFYYPAMVLNHKTFEGDLIKTPHGTGAWNETRWTAPEFSQLLTQANGTLDVEKRRQIFCQLEKIRQERGSIANAFWINA